jgi:hypothetical protein
VVTEVRIILQPRAIAPDGTASIRILREQARQSPAQIARHFIERHLPWRLILGRPARVIHQKRVAIVIAELLERLNQ